MVSVIVPVYNVEKYLEQCVDSIRNQELKELEIILVDDGSKDHSSMICDEYAKKDSRIKVIHKANGGLMSAWKVGFKEATGEYIGFVDSDDWIDPDMYRKLYDAVKVNRADIALCGWIREGQNKHEKEKIYLDTGMYNRSALEETVFPKMLNFGKMLERYISPNRVTKLFKRELIEKNFPYYDEGISIGEDLIASFSAILDADSIYVLADFFPYHYRLNEESLMEKLDFNFYKKSLRMNNQFRKIIEEKKIEEFDLQLNNDLLSLAFWGIERAVRADAGKKDKLQYIQDIFKNLEFKRALKKQTLSKNNKKCAIYIIISRFGWVNILYIFISKLVLKKRELFGY